MELPETVGQKTICSIFQVMMEAQGTTWRCHTFVQLLLMKGGVSATEVISIILKNTASLCDILINLVTMALAEGF